MCSQSMYMYWCSCLLKQTIKFSWFPKSQYWQNLLTFWHFSDTLDWNKTSQFIINRVHIHIYSNKIQQSIYTYTATKYNRVHIHIYSNKTNKVFCIVLNISAVTGDWAKVATLQHCYQVLENMYLNVRTPQPY